MALSIGDDDDALEEERRRIGDDLRGERRAAEHADAIDAGVDQLDLGQALGADGRANAVGADKNIALGGGPVGERQADAGVGLLVRRGRRHRGAESR